MTEFDDHELTRTMRKRIETGQLNPVTGELTHPPVPDGMAEGILARVLARSVPEATPPPELASPDPMTKKIPVRPRWFRQSATLLAVVAAGLAFILMVVYVALNSRPPEAPPAPDFTSPPPADAPGLPSYRSPDIDFKQLDAFVRGALAREESQGPVQMFSDGRTIGNPEEGNPLSVLFFTDDVRSVTFQVLWNPDGNAPPPSYLVECRVEGTGFNVLVLLEKPSRQWAATCVLPISKLRGKWTKPIGFVARMIAKNSLDPNDERIKDLESRVKHNAGSLAALKPYLASQK